MTRILSIKEHQPLSSDTSIYTEVFDENVDLLKKFPDATNAKGNIFLGCYVEGWPSPEPKASYYVGLTWLIEDKYALQINPKINDLDFLNMFMTCMKCMDNDVQNKIMHIYGIDFSKPFIETQGLHIDITPFIIIHFISLLEPIIRKGLKRNYVFEEDNLNSKLKGKLQFSQHFKRNILNKRFDRNYCKYQEYSVDCIENRILKKALLFAESYTIRHKLSLPDEYTNIILRAKNALSEVSDIFSPSEIERFKSNPLYKEYARAISVAKLILRRFGYDVQRAEEQSNLVPPFWIDMSLLFEIYILGLLREKYGQNIKYHISTYGNEIDFGKTDEKMIIDTKYIYHWDENINHENVRQLSGYARNKQIRRKLLGDVYENEILPCMFIYPNANGIERFENNKLLQEERLCSIDEYLEFYKIGVKLPKINRIQKS